MKRRRNGSLTAHGRKWPLYERREGALMVLFMSPEDRAEKERLDKSSLGEFGASRRPVTEGNETQLEEVR